MRILLIEDELPAAERLRTLLLQLDNSLELAGPLDSNAAILEWFAAHEPPDLIFSDIELLDGPVFAALEQLELATPIVFTTAYDQYALEAFRTSGIAYLLKPFQAEDLASAMSKYRSLTKTHSAATQQQILAELKRLHQQSAGRYKSRLFGKVGEGMYLLSVDDVACIGTHHGLVHAFQPNGRKLPLSETLSQLEEQLAPAHFHRINRSEIVRIDYIEKVEPYFNDRLAITVSGQPEVLITSAGRTPGFRQWLKEQ